ncbi:alpha/beta fold hydrolase [Rhodotorula paludigena]|uniref:alpha/beta fold hydrolase n=1 Tax=Rhodotorula paludigena TaxID=86838 RepID=UPI0031732270
MTSFPASFAPETFSLPHSHAQDSLPASSLFALVSRPTSSPDAAHSAAPVLVFLHGYPQNHTLWSPVLHWLDQHTDVVQRFRIVVPDLPGYGQSRKAVSPDGSHEAYSKREVGKDMLALVDALWPGDTPKVVLIGHDRGARVAYRLAKDRRDRIVGLSVQDIVPTIHQFKRMSYANGRHLVTLSASHWIFLGSPSPVAEKFLLSSPSLATWYAAHNIAAWSGSRFKAAKPDGDLAGELESRFDPAALASWTEQYADRACVLGSLEDYRAGASIDLVHDEADGPDGERVQCPLLALWSGQLERAGEGVPEGKNMRETWEARGPEGDTRAKRVGDDGVGHFLPVEAVEETAREVAEWIAKYW